MNRPSSGAKAALMPGGLVSPLPFDGSISLYVTHSEDSDLLGSEIRRSGRTSTLERERSGPLEPGEVVGTLQSHPPTPAPLPLRTAMTLRGTE
jgi:hypothetical protein